MLRLGELLPIYYIDLKFMAAYWKALFDYLEYDPLFIRLFIDTYNTKYPIEEDIKMPVEIRNSRAEEVEKIVRKAMRTDKWKHFWKR